LTKIGLLVTPIFSPASMPESHLMAKLLSSVPGCKFEVVTFKPWKKWMGNDDSFKDIIESGFGTVHYISLPRILTLLPLSKFWFISRYPDSYRIFNYYLTKKSKELLNLKKFDVMLSWSQPHSVHLVVLKLLDKYKFDIPWIAHFSDPWIDNPYTKYKFWQKKYNTILLRRIAQRASAIVVTNHYMAEFEKEFKTTSVSRKIKIIPHSFNPLMYSTVRPNQISTTFMIRHIGNFYGSRNPHAFLKALALMETFNPTLSKGLHVEFYGTGYDKKTINLIKNFKLIEVKFFPKISYQKSLDKIQSSDLLLVFDAPVRVNPFLPSKLVDYIGSLRPILAFTSEGPTKDLVLDLGNWVSSLESEFEAYETILDAITTLSSKKFTYSPKRDIIDKYSVVENGKLLGDIIRSL
jgi:glycosyltransferase involved in cell wall biosynthesis